MTHLAATAWPLTRLADAFEALIRSAALARTMKPGPPGPCPTVEDDDEVDCWVQAAARSVDLEAEAVEIPVCDVEAFLRQAGPALFVLRENTYPGVLALVRGGRRWVHLVGPDARVRRVKRDEVSDILRRTLEAPLMAEVDDLLERAGVAPTRRSATRTALLREQLASRSIAGCWLIRLPPGAHFGDQCRHAGVTQMLAVFAAAHVVHDLLWVLAWWLIGRAALEGRYDRGWLLAWALLLLTLVPLRMLATWAQGVLTVVTSSLLRRRLLTGALKMEPDSLRHLGVGSLLGRVIESETLESLAQSGAFLGLVAVLELVMATLILGMAPGGLVYVCLLIAWLAVTVALGLRYFRDRRAWTGVRLKLTEDLVERIVGHRTRLAQEDPTRWHDAEDQAVDRCLHDARRMDSRGALLEALVPRGWLFVGVGWLAVHLIAAPPSWGALAIAFGGVLLAYRALLRVAASISDLAGAAIAWHCVAPFFRAAAGFDVPGLPAVPTMRYAGNDGGNDAPVLAAHDVMFRYAGQAEPVLRGCSLEIAAGDRILLLGASGGGKSTLASILTGVRTPDSGLLLFRGLDRDTIGVDAWRRRVVAAPQFHENHVFTGALAFNLLMGRRWPPTPQDLKDAEALCHELGLGELVTRMPGGLFQIVGETGWQLSHGERSRLYLARALLKDADVVVLDESFAELDAPTLHRCLECATKRTPSLIVIAHP